MISFRLCYIENSKSTYVIQNEYAKEACKLAEYVINDKLLTTARFLKNMKNLTVRFVGEIPIKWHMRLQQCYVENNSCKFILLLFK